MTDALLELTSAVYAKTLVGQQEIQTRSLGLAPVVRRLLVLIDGHRSGRELASFVPGADIAPLLTELIAQGCIDAPAPAAPTPVAQPAAGSDPALSALPAAETRSAQDIEMARNFMTNTVNTMFGQNTRLTLLEAVFACQTAQDLRRVYPAWVETMTASRTGAARLPELRVKLFKVL